MGKVKRGVVALILLLLPALAVGQNANTATFINGASTQKSSANSKYEAGSEGYIYTMGASNSPAMVGYMHFNFAAAAPTPSRFCASGTPMLYMNNYTVKIFGIEICRKPTSGMNVVTEVPPTTWVHTNLYWNNQPSMSSHLGQRTQSTYTSYSGTWYSITLSASMLNAAVRQSASAASLRVTHNQNGQMSCWHGKNNKPYIKFDYTTCDVNASCNANNMCVCNSGYMGSGASCTVSSCAATTMGNANFPTTPHAAVGTGTCLSTYGGSPTAACLNAQWGAVSSPCTKLTCAAGSSGNAHFPITNAGVTATGTCLSGYSGEGTPSRECTVNGVWSTVSNSCDRNVCQATTIGTASFPLTDSLEVATGSCADGYSGSPQCTCSAAGTWGSVTQPCTQRSCTGYSDNANHVTWPTALSFATSAGQCEAGWAGTPTRLCQSDGTFAAMVGSCVQLKCANELAYELADWAVTNSGDIATGVCVSGYYGSPKRTCELSGSWSTTVHPSCTRHHCGAETSLNAIWPVNTPSNTVAQGTCVAGFSGTPTRQCEADGQWASTVTNPCTQIFCSPATLNNAEWPSTAAGTTNVSANCTAGYSGLAIRDCDFYGNWSPLSQQCTRIKCGAITDSNAEWVESDSLTIAAGSCVAGWTGSPTRPCSADGTFGAITNPCTQIRCPHIESNHVTWESAAAGTNVVMGICELGFSGTPQRACDISGSWGGVTGSCEQVKCAPISDPIAKASWAEANAGSTSVPGTCSMGTSGLPARDCFYNGTWSDVVNPCSTDPCPALVNDAHANWPSSSAGSTEYGVCVAGYSTAIMPSRLCREDGTWDSVIMDPCVPLYCTHESGSYAPFGATWPESLQAGFSTTGTCNAGYTGTTQRSCSLSASWSTPSPLCQEIFCLAVSDDGSHQSWPSTKAGTEATGSCHVGYTGSPKRACDINGQWTSSVTDPCTQQKCAATSADTSDWPEALGGTTVSGTCKSGYAGNVLRTCSIAGVWGVISGSCSLVSCAAETIDNIIWASTAAGSSASGVCVTGYSSTQTPVRACLGNGVWDTATGSCTRNRCMSVEFNNALWPTANSMTTGVPGECVEGWQGTPLRNCSADGLYSAVSNPCTKKMCFAVDDGSLGSWGSVEAGSFDVVGTCPSGSSGSPTRSCLLNGAWGTISGTCTTLQCPPTAAGNADWPLTSAGSSAAGVCNSGYLGSPSRLCGLDGGWGSIVNPCVLIKCPAVEDGNALWSESDAFASVTGTCNAGYSGSPTRVCDGTGNWGDITNGCTEIFCASNQLDNAQWQQTRAGEVAIGSCLSGYDGTPRRSCGVSGIWNSTIVNPCIVHYDNCPSESVGLVFFPSALPSTNSIGTCPTGYNVSAAGPPTRACLFDGTWEPLFSNPCDILPADDSADISNLRWTSKTSTSITLVWNMVNATENTTYRVDVAISTGSFVIANMGQAINFKGESFTIDNLFQNTLYSVRVMAGEHEGYNEPGAAIIPVTTYISQPGPLQLGSASTDSLTFSWGVSALAQYYEIHYRLVVPLRNVSDGFTLWGTASSDAASATVDGLESGRTYEILVLAGHNNATEQVGARLMMTTSSTTDNIVEDPGLGVNGTIIAAASVAGVVALIVIVIVVMVVIRRRRRRTADKMAEFGGAEALSSLKEYRQTLARSRGSMKHAESTTHLSHADKTIVNTVMEVALPGFLLVDYATTIQPGALLDASEPEGGCKTMILDFQVASRVGSKEANVYDFEEQPDLDAEMNTELFHREVSLMWSLSFHPNIVSLVAYTDVPRSFVTRRYESNLNQLIHSGDHTTIESSLLHHLVSSIASGLSAVHSMQLSHRSLSPRCILIQPAGVGDVYPTPVLSNLSNAIAVGEGIPNRIAGEALRYAAPEVHRQRIESVSVEDEPAADVYAAGVIFMEMYTRVVPWATIDLDKISQLVVEGQTLSFTPDSDDDVLRSQVAAIIDSILSAEVPSSRPDSAVICNQLASAII